MLGYPKAREYSPWPDAAEVDAMVAEVAALLEQGGALRSRIAARARVLGEEAVQVVDPLAGA
jgi:hypothetical protein